MAADGEALSRTHVAHALPPSQIRSTCATTPTGKLPWSAKVQENGAAGYVSRKPALMARLSYLPVCSPRDARCHASSKPPKALMLDMLGGFALGMKYFFKAQGDDQLPLRERAALARAFAANTRCAATRTAKSAASPASFARRSARRKRSPSRPSPRE